MRHFVQWITGRPIMMRLALGGSFIALITVAFSQQKPGESLHARFVAMSAEYEKKGLAEPFKGITAKGDVEAGLFAIKSSGVTTEPVRKAADAFLAALTPAQRDKTMFAVDDPEWRKWMNQHFYIRQGVSFEEMSESQRASATQLLRAALSAKGLKLTQDIMHLNETLGELNNNDFVQYGEFKYHITVMGKPSAKDPWGWQLDGHHVIINYFVLGDQVVMTPFFIGSEPVIAPSGKYKGTTILQNEQNSGLALIRALSEDQRKQAVLEFSKKGNNNLTEAFKDNVVLDYAGADVSKFTPAQRKQLMELIALYVDNMDEGHARVKMSEVKRYLDRTRFAWIGGTEPGSVFYYRIHSPVVLIEFDHQLPVATKMLVKDASIPSQQHVHCVVRTPNGNDYGKDLLRQHYERSTHGS